VCTPAVLERYKMSYTVRQLFSLALQIFSLSSLQYDRCS
jgi:hypothetical protein